MDEFDRKWQRIQDQLGAQIRGDAPHLTSSGRTLFGIRSSVEIKMDEVAREMEERAQDQTKTHNNKEDQS